MDDDVACDKPNIVAVSHYVSQNDVSNRNKNAVNSSAQDAIVDNARLTSHFDIVAYLGYVGRGST